ncbi:hypothetical protein AVEN_62642-1, partial [Araneus ventricosus]
GHLAVNSEIDVKKGLQSRSPLVTSSETLMLYYNMTVNGRISDFTLNDAATIIE